MASTSAAFSYAQAAMGVAAPATPPNTDPITANQASNGAPEPNTEHSEKGATPVITRNNTEETFQDSTEKTSKASHPDGAVSSETGKGPVKDVENALESSKVNPSGTSTDTVAKSTDGSEAITEPEKESVKASTSEVLGAEQVGEKHDNDTEDQKLSTYEQAKPQMKEAPMPSVNVWQKPWEAGQTKGVSKPGPSVTKIESSGFPAARDASSNATTVKPSSTSAQSAPGRPKAEALNRNGPATTPSFNNQVSLDSDTSLWPTPNSLKSDEKKTGAEKSELPEKTNTRPHGKEKWEKVAFVPTAVFNTPLPIRGGRGGRIGGRGGRENATRGGISASAAPSGDSSNVTTDVETQTPAGNTGERFKARDTTNPRGGFASKPKRSSSTGVTGVREPVNEAVNEKRESFNQRSANAVRPNDARQYSGPVQQDPSNAQPVGLDAHKRSSLSSEANGETRFSRSYQAKSRDFGQEQNGYISSRERGDGRPERGGRGNWRGKSNGQAHGSYASTSHYQSSFSNGKSFAEQRQNSHPAAYPGPREPRHSRANSRSQSIPNGQAYGRFGASNVGINGLPALQTDVANAMPMAQQPAIMSAVPYQHFMESVQLPAMVQLQLEYYFSVDNLCKDIFLRSHMDSQGFAPLPFLANFQRIKQLTTDMNMLKWACGRSKLLELVTTHEGYDLVRKSEEWQPWVLPYDQREPAAKNEGPTQLLSPRFEGFQPMFNGFEGYPAMSHSVPISPANSFLMNGYRGEMFPIETNGYRGPVYQNSIMQTPLSADVPDFQPAKANGRQEAKFQNLQEPEQKFSTGDIDQLRIHVKPSKGDGVSYDESSAQPITNGNSHHHDDENSKPKLNGTNAESHNTNGVADEHQDFTKLSNGHHSPRQPASTPDSATITWSVSSKEANDGVTYHSLRTRAREEQTMKTPSSSAESTQTLYKFWTLFLVDNFNIQMYQDFHSTALEDANVKQSLTGLKHLVDFYSACLQSKTVLADRLLKDFTDLVSVELSNEHIPKERPALTQLRKMWSQGELSKSNRLNLSQKVDDSLKSALGPAQQSP